MKTSFLGLRTAIYPVTDLAKAKEWYRSVLGIDPYFDEPFYVGFSVGGYELGLHPDTSKVPPGMAGVTAYWGVADARKAWRRLLESFAEPFTPVRDVGGGILVAEVLDPFGNVFGIIENPHFRAAGADSGKAGAKARIGRKGKGARRGKKRAKTRR